jgi:hypothetical protein
MQNSGSRLFDCGAHEPLALRLAGCSTSAWVHFNGKAELPECATEPAAAPNTHTHTHCNNYPARTLSDERDGVRHALLP